MPTNTTTYSFQKPVVGADEDAWGGYLNGNWDKVDDLFDGTTPVTGIDINSGTLDGVTIGGTTAGAGTFTTLTATTSITGTLATAAQPNITSVGSLTSLDVQGTVTADGLTVDGVINVEGNNAGVTDPLNAVNRIRFIDNDPTQVADQPTGTLEWYTSDAGSVGVHAYISTDMFNNGSGDMLIATGSGGSPTQSMRIGSTGDISFYEDTGTTAKFFWDASAERLGIGVGSSVGEALHIKGTGRFENSNATPVSVHINSGNNDYGQIFASTSSAWKNLVLNQYGGNVGIGTSSPSAPLHINGGSANVVLKATNSSNTTGLFVGARDGAFGSIFSAGDGYIYQGNGKNLSMTADGGGVVRFGTGSTERMRIDSSGNVGIGTSSPSSYLHIKDSNGGLVQTIEAGDSSAAYTKYINSTTGNGAFTDGLLIGLDTDESATFWLYEADHMKFATNNAERMRIDSSGNLLVGKTSSSTTTNGIQLQADYTISAVSTGVGYFYNKSDGGSGTSFLFRSNNLNVGSITVTSSSTAYNTSSDYRLKENVVELTGATTRLKQLEPKRFNFIADADTTVDGFLAHEVQSIVPEAITGTHNEVDADGNPVYQGIDQSKLVPLLVATIKELEARITSLENA